MAKCTHFTLLLLLPQLLTASQDELLISTKNGKVQGKLLSAPGGDVRAFLGIPFGKPPVGNLRFRHPEPAEKWEGVKDATKYPNACYQATEPYNKGFRGEEMWLPNTPVSEDCLYLNVWSPRVDKNNSALRSVLVWIYGGGFNSGTSSLDLYDGRYMSLSEDVVVVSMNYRVGPLGFLSLPDNKNIRGNAGMMDQRLALRWVSENIAAFGGDPSKVTLFGESAGSASVGLQLLSPGSNKYFQRVVMQSGSPTASWATISKTEMWERSKTLARYLLCPTFISAKLEACLLKADPAKLTAMQFYVSLSPTVFLPSIDGDFLPSPVEVLMNSRDLPKKDVMLGLNKDEGTYFLFSLPGFSIKGQSLISRSYFLRAVGLFMGQTSEISKNTAIFQYSDWADVDNKKTNRDAIGSLVGDMMFCSVLDFAHRYAKNGGRTFLYSFEHQSSINPWPQWAGVMHGYEIEFIFGNPMNPSLGYTKQEVDMSKRFMKHWANFAKKGNPSFEGANWPMFTPEKQEYVVLNTDKLKTKAKLRAQVCHFWNNLIPQLEKVSYELQSCKAAQ